MFEKYFVSRKAYDKDVRVQRARAEETLKTLRAIEQEKAQAEAKMKSFGKEREMLHREIEQLNKRLETKVTERDLKEYMNPVPVKEDERKQYMSQVSGIFHGGLRDKLNHLHSSFRNQTGMFPLTERETDFFRSCINVVGLLLDWGEECSAEHNANIAVANDTAEVDAFAEPDEDTKKAVKKIRKTVKKKK